MGGLGTVCGCEPCTSQQGEAANTACTDSDSTHLRTHLVLPFLCSEEEAQVVPQRQPGVDPEQLAVLAEQFDAQDEDGDGGCFG